MFIPLSILGGLTSAVPGVYQLFEGIRQRKEAKQGLSGLTRPEYQTPEEIGRMLNISQNRYADKFMPGQGVTMDRIEQQAANAFTQSSEAGDPFALIANLQAQAGNQLQDVGTQSANYQLQNEKAYQQALMEMSKYKDLEFQMNKFAPYKEKYNEYRDMFGAGTKNIYGALDSLSNIGTGMLGSLFSGQGEISLGGKGGGGNNGLNNNAAQNAVFNYNYGQFNDPTNPQPASTEEAAVFNLYKQFLKSQGG